MKLRRISIPVRGLGCGGGGASSIERAIARLDGVSAVYVNPATAEAYVDFEATRCDVPSIAAAIARLGFRPGSAAELGPA